MIGLYIEDEGLKSELEKRLKDTGCFLCNGYSPKLDLIIVQGKDKGTMDTLIMSETNVILIAECGSDPYINLCYYSFIKPLCTHTLMTLIKGMDIEEKDYSYISSEVFLDLGVSPGVKGYGYLKDAVNLHLNHEDYQIKDIYELIGLYRNTDAKNVERSIRYAIESAFDKCRIESQERIFKNSIDPLKGKPTNMELIYRVGDFIKIGK